MNPMYAIADALQMRLTATSASQGRGEIEVEVHDAPFQYKMQVIASRVEKRYNRAAVLCSVKGDLLLFCFVDKGYLGCWLINAKTLSENYKALCRDLTYLQLKVYFAPAILKSFTRATEAADWTPLQ